MKREIKLKVLRNWRFVLEWATFAGIICMTATFALTASILPMPAPPVGADGLVAKYGMRTVLFILFALGGGLCGLLFLLSRFPRLYKYPVKINADNVELQYHIAKIALCAGQLIAVVVTCVLMLRVYNQNITTDSADFRDMLIQSGIAGCAVYFIYFLTARKFR
ncbi:hypothetical protein [Christensenella intestinihominis]|uniref:hypothetical protein n=1 Tax=Christensenella intestinihominis TaxID=1851429 RepID=UPI000834DA7C|nr:hypothetical protein [Christensenella intestinihominis]